MWAKITAGLGVALMAAWYYIKLLSSKNARLEHKNKVNGKIKEIRVKQEEYREEVLIDETDRFETRVKDNSTKSRRDRADGL